MYAKIIDDETKLCEVGIGTNAKFYKSIGMTEMDVEQAYNGNWYLKGYAPEPTEEEKEQKVRAVRDAYLAKWDFSQLRDAPFTEEEKDILAEYRQYLRDYTKTENWWEQEPATYEDWLAAHHPVSE